jgi:hypothetical protein
MHRHQPVELIFDLFQHHRRAARDNGDAREVLLVFGFRNRERVDIVAASGEQPDDARQNAGLVIDEDAQGASFDALACRGGGVMSRRCVHGSSPTPASCLLR